MRQLTRPLILATAALLAGGAAMAAGPQAGMDPNTFIVGHPASPTWKLVHANQEHPAVLVARRAQEQEARHLSVVDANQFIVQPPASVRWVATSPTPLLIAAVGR